MKGVQRTTLVNDSKVAILSLSSASSFVVLRLGLLRRWLGERRECLRGLNFWDFDT